MSIASGVGGGGGGRECSMSMMEAELKRGAVEKSIGGLGS